MNIPFRVVLTLTVLTILTSCGDLGTVGHVTPTQPQSTIIPEKPASHSLDSTVVCCFCGMLDS